MKILAGLTILVLFLTIQIAKAESVIDLAELTSDLSVAATQDLEFLDENMENCTRYADKIRDMMLEPISEDVTTIHKTIATTYGNLEHKDGGTCIPPSKQDLTKGITQINKFIALIGEKLEIASTKTGKLFGKTPDTAIKAALTSDLSRKWPKCRPAVGNDVNTTPELQAYLSLKENFVEIRNTMIALKEETQALLENKGETVCKKD